MDSEFTCNMSQDYLPRRYLDAKKSVRQGLYNFALELYGFFAFIGRPEVLSTVRNRFFGLKF
jgi:hypothetical protein